MQFAKKLTSWYLENKRDLPWRRTNDPYAIWLSEIILQQTRVSQGLPYYQRFQERFPSVFDLAEASEEEVLKEWQGLGYYSRARNLHAAAKFVCEDLGGVFPATYHELLSLKGVGDYTASAVASICYDEPVVVVDGNVFRMLARIFGVNIPINTGEGKRRFKEIAQELLESSDPSTFNQAMMEFGALQCTPKGPNCMDCPFIRDCVAHNQGLVSELPVKVKKKKETRRHFNFLVIKTRDGRTCLNQRVGRGIWRGLYEFPLIETSSEISWEMLIRENQWEALEKPKDFSVSLFNESPIIHKLSHQHIYTKFWILNCESTPWDSILISDIHKFPVPALIEKFIKEFGF